ncbi:MAG: glycosyltransferase family 2 protein, partial [Actinomycetota bacterium]|nr:glycosyltransferase family 2 protein [Actinomycetota bacterium]
MPTASVVVPTHDRNHLLLQTLGSVIRQGDVDLEVIVVDDGSTQDVAAAVASLSDDRIRVVRNERSQGVARARNRGMEEAGGEWVAFVDDDDLWAPDKLTSQLQALARTGRRWAYTGAVNITASAQVIGGAPPAPPEEVAASLPRRNTVPGGGSNVVAARSLLDEVGGFDPTLFNTEDWDMWIRMARAALPAWVPRPLLAYRVHATNASLVVSEIIAGARTIERRYGGPVDRGVVDRYLAELCLRSGDRLQAVRFFARGAVRGQAKGVSSDLASIARRRLRRSSSDGAKPREPQWLAEGRAWVEDLHEKG